MTRTSPAVDALPSLGVSHSMGSPGVRRDARSVQSTVRWLIVLLGLVCHLGTPAEVASAETKKVVGTLASFMLIARTEMFSASILATGHLESRSRGLISQDADWNRAALFTTSYFDPAAQLERQTRGHMVITHPGGDQTFLLYDISWKHLGSIELEWQILGRFVRGTGRFKGISGTYRERSRLTATGDVGEWETEYTLP